MWHTVGHTADSVLMLANCVRENQEATDVLLSVDGELLAC